MPAPATARPPEPASKVFRDFVGMSVAAPRQSIADEKAYWLENLQPIAPGNLKIANPPSVTYKTIAAETVISSQSFNINGTDYIFAIMSSGHAYAILASNPYTATKITATLGAIFGSTTRMAQWKNAGVLFISPTGYYDYNITVPGVLSAISSAVNGLTVTAQGTGYTTQPSLVFAGGTTGTNATGIADLWPQGVAIVAAGAGYALGDLFVVVGGVGSVPFTGRVTGVGGGGSVTAATNFSPAAIYTTLPGAASATTAVTGGGTGLTVTVNNVGITNPRILTSGSGYIAAPTVTVTGGGGAGGTVTATFSAAFAGTSIATYAGRVWIGNLRTVAFTDVDSYNSFGGAGSSFTITDETLHGYITRLISANGYLYIFGDDSIDLLGDVQVSGGTTSFTRQNITASVGTICPWSVFPYLRSLAFANQSGFYLLSGSTPQKISEDLDELLTAIDFTKEIFGGQVMVNNQLCAAFLFTFTDSFTPTGGSRVILALYYRGRWWVAAQGTTLKTVASFPQGGVSTLFGLATSGADTIMTELFFNSGAILTAWQAITKLYDCGNPLLEKQVIRAGAGIKWIGSNAGASITIKVDNEAGVSNAVAGVPVSPFPTSGYTFNAGASNVGGGNFIGMTISGSTLRYQLTQLALEYNEGPRWKTP